ncbi:divalent-cation tolerance protein CutA, partial [Candidatus Woesearchaeota archaeon CG11_big_fil_rev_8_21_14_0_20_57_5]
MKLVLAYIPCPSASEAERIGKQLVEQRLCACANWSSMRSCYRWEGAVKTENEWLLLAKTSPDKKDALRAAVEKTHPYAVP